MPQPTPLAAVPRNAPCPCGSGQKHKRCCAGKLEAEAAARGRSLTLALIVVGILAGGYVALAKDLELGLAVAGGIIVLAGIIDVFRNPPAPRQDKKDPASMNFGN